MNNILVPPTWLITVIIGLPILSQTIYLPLLSEIAYTLQVTDSMVEYSLTVYLFGFAIGILFWGKFSDKFGRKPCVIAGLIIFIIGCSWCYLTFNIEMLMIGRVIQAFGGSIASVLGQSICRDVFHGPELAKAYSSMATALSLCPALGPLFGVVIAERLGWNNIFSLLALLGIILTVLVIIKLPETHLKNNRQSVSIINITLRLIQDKKVIGFTLIIAGCNGILYSYFAEGAFYLIKILGLSPSKYGFSLAVVAASAMMGGILSQELYENHGPQKIIGYGLNIIIISTTIFSIIVLVTYSLCQLSTQLMIVVTIFNQMTVAFGIRMVTSNILALVLADYNYAIGTTSSLFGFCHYCLISAFTFGMGFLHNGTLIPMPLYFLTIGLFMIITKQILLNQNTAQK